KARAGQLPNFTGIDSAYEPPEAPEITLKGAEQSPDEMIDLLLDSLRHRKII
ncbi:adenylylsulfate kinase-like enzyme, partial [Azospirillum picis]